MKTLSAAQDAARTQNDKSIYWFAKISWPSPYGDKYYAERDFLPDPAITVSPIMQSFPVDRREYDIDAEPNIFIGQASFTLRNLPDDIERPEILIENLDTAQGVEVNLYGVFEPATGSISSSDWILFGRYRIWDYEITTDRITLNLRDYPADAMDRLVGRLILADDFATAPADSLNRMIPIIFGTMTKVPCILTEKGARTNLSAAITNVQTTIPVDDVSSFPTSGTILIGNEEITYTAVDTTPGANTFGTGGAPATRGANGTTNQAHPDNAVVRELMSRYRYLLADHACVSATNGLVNDEIPVSISKVETALNGQTVSYIDLTSLPIIEIGGVNRYLAEEEVFLTVDVSGLDDPEQAGTQVLEDPENILRYLVENSAFMNLDASDIDTTNTDAAIASATGGTWVHARRISLRETNREHLRSFAWSAGIRIIWENGAIRAIPSLNIDSSNADFLYDVDEIHSLVDKRYAHNGYVYNQIDLFYAQSFLPDPTYSKLSVSEDTLSQQATWGIRKREFRSPWIQDDTTADALAALLNKEFAWRRSIATFDGPLNWIDAELGDGVQIDDADSRLYLNTGRLARLSLPQPEIFRFGIVIPDQRLRIWEYDSDNYIDLYSGTSRMSFVVGGNECMRINSDGILRLKGNIQEATYTAETVLTATDSPTGHIEYVVANSSIGFGNTNVAGTNVILVSELLTNGNLKVYQLKEDVDYPLSAASSPTFSAYYEWFAATTSLDFSLQKQRTYIRFARTIISTKTNTILKCAGIRENAL